MALSVKPAIPAKHIVNVVPSVLGAGGAALDLVELMLTSSFRPPIGQVMSFSDTNDVEQFFGAESQEAALAAIYFNGPNNATTTPDHLLFTQYNTAAVSAYLRGGKISGLTLAALQALTGTLSVVIDAVTKTGSVNLSAATSFSNAAEIIADALSIEGVQAAVVTGSVGGTFTCTSSGTTLTVSAVLTGSLQVGDLVSGTDGTNSLPGGCSILQQLTGTAGSTGTYELSAAATPGNLGSCTVTSSSTVLDVTGVTSGTLGVGDQIQATGITAGTYIASQISGTTGGVGLYTISTHNTHASETITAFTPAVQYDSITGTFSIFSGTTGALSTIAFATGAMATSLLLTQATGAVLSQGAAAATPIAFMDAIIRITQNWATFQTLFEPDDADKESFATWTNNQKNRYAYLMVDTNILDTESGGPSVPVGFINNGQLSGICMIYEDPSVDTVGTELAAFVGGWAASLDFTRFRGRQTLAFKSQSGLQPQVFDDTIATQLESFGLNYYGDFTTAAQQFNWMYPGSVSGEFLWFDSYINQIWLNNQLQLGIMEGLGNTPAIPYNAVGAALIESFCMDAIVAGVNFGAIVAGVELSQAQIAEVNNLAGLDLTQTLFNRGWYLQVLPATAQVRAARGSPPCTLWYVDGGSVQKITLASIEIQ